MSFPKIGDPESAMSYGAEILRGKQVRLRTLASGDIDSPTEWWQRSDWSVLQQGTRPRGQAAIADMFLQWSANETIGSIGFSIEDQVGNLVCHTTLWGANLPARSAVFSIILGPSFVNKGYGTDATQTMVRYGFEELGSHRIELQTWAFNTRAIRAYENAGFTREGVRRAATFHGGDFHDEVLMGILEVEYRARRRTVVSEEVNKRVSRGE